MGMKSGPGAPVEGENRAGGGAMPDTPGVGSGWEVCGGEGMGSRIGVGGRSSMCVASECQACRVGSGCAS